MIENTFTELKSHIVKDIKKHKWNSAMQGIAAYCDLSYQYNQKYLDVEVEDYVQKISDYALPMSLENREGNDRVVLFYDNFGLDTRGLALIYLKALVESGYKVIYVTRIWAKECQPEIHKVVEQGDIKWIYLTESIMMKRCVELCQVFVKYCPRVSFFYTTPNDAVGAVAFAKQAGRTVRFQINLTDHAFWIGCSVIDYCIEFRNYGAYISNKYRGISKDKLLMLPFYPYIDYEQKFEGFPFDTDGKKIVFSGGALYKTHGENNLYYRMVKEILRRNKNCIFLYAGIGDGSELVALQREFPNRVYHIMERKDLYELIRHCDIYLNTYPLGGALMMKYAAVAGRFPYTLRHGDDNADGLMHQEEIGIEYDNAKLLIDDISCALQDETYGSQKNQLVRGCVISEDEFREQLCEIIEKRESRYEIDLLPIDVKKMQETYSERFQAERIISGTLTRKEYYLLSIYYPKYWIKKIFDKIQKRGK